MDRFLEPANMITSLASCAIELDIYKDVVASFQFLSNLISFRNVSHAYLLTYIKYRLHNLNIDTFHGLS